MQRFFVDFVEKVILIWTSFFQPIQERVKREERKREFERDEIVREEREREREKSKIK